jgi:hypothetical protein
MWGEPKKTGVTSCLGERLLSVALFFSFCLCYILLLISFPLLGQDAGEYHLKQENVCFGSEFQKSQCMVV